MSLKPEQVEQLKKLTSLEAVKKNMVNKRSSKNAGRQGSPVTISTSPDEITAVWRDLQQQRLYAAGEDSQNDLAHCLAAFQITTGEDQVALVVHDEARWSLRGTGEEFADECSEAHPCRHGGPGSLRGDGSIGCCEGEQVLRLVDGQVSAAINALAQERRQRHGGTGDVLFFMNVGTNAMFVALREEPAASR